MNNEAKILQERVNIYKDNALKYFHANLPVIPDKFGSKQPAIRAWSDYCYKMPTKDEILSWSSSLEEKGSGVALCLGSQSGIIALDIDADEQHILDVIMPLLPSSPLVKKGAKGETRFFRFTGEQTDILKFNGKVVVEVLSNGKKTTLPPSLHPSGVNYKWISKDTLLDISNESLPILPPALFSHIASVLKLKFPESVNQGYNKVFNGRNDALSSLCGKLIGEGKTVDETLRALIDYDEKENEIPLFTDPEENRTTHAITNALQFYSNHLSSINTKRFRESKTYETPVLQTVADLNKIEEVRSGKSQSKEKLKNPSVDALVVQSAVGNLYSTILSNNWVKQENLSFGASLSVYSTLISRKVVFQGMSPNLYVLNVSPSGSGKNAPQEMVKNILMDIRAEDLLGAGDYVSDASLMDSLQTNPVRLDIMDEAGGILRSINSGRGEYNGKMADVLAELYTTSNNKYLGRATAEGRKGSCYRPNVNLLASTTPAGFSEGVTLKAIEKGLMGRFLIFEGDSKQRAERLTKFPKIDVKTRNNLLYWYSFNPSDFNVTDTEIAGLPQNYVELEANEEANALLDSIFKEFDDRRIGTKYNDPMLPVLARLYQQMVKLVIIHACARVVNTVPIINTEDVNFAYKVINFCYNTMERMVKNHIFGNNQERNVGVVLNAVRDHGGEITKTELFRSTRELRKRDRDDILRDLVESGELLRDVRNIKGRQHTIYLMNEV